MIFNVKKLFLAAFVMSLISVLDAKAAWYPNGKCEGVDLHQTGCEEPTCFVWDTSGCYEYYYGGLWHCAGRYKCAKAEALYAGVIWLCLDGGEGCEGSQSLHNLSNRYEGTGTCSYLSGSSCTGHLNHPWPEGQCTCNNKITYNCSGHLCD